MCGASLAIARGRSSLTQKAWPTSKFRPIDGAFDPLGDLEVLVGRLEQQARLGLDQEQDAELVGVLGQRLEDLDEQVDRLLPATAPGRAARPARS